MLELKGIEAVCGAAAAFPKNITLQKYALWMIQYCSHWDHFKAAMVRDGALQTLAEMVERFSVSANSEANLKSARATIHRLLS